MDVAGPLQALHEAAGFGAPYASSFVAPSPAVLTAQGLEFSGLEPLPNVARGDRVIIPGYLIGATRPPSALVSWLRGAHAAGAELCAVCTGAFALGEAGLLDGRRCTTHWRRVNELAAQFPRARVLGERLFVIDEQIITSAGIAAGIDMTLALLERDDGAALASAVAREMVVYLRRDGAQKQKSVYLDFQTHMNPGVHRLQQHLIAHPSASDTLADLARVAGMSERNLTRMFKRATGISVQEYRTRLRVERARTLLRDPTLTVDAVAHESGFGSARQMRRAWAAHMTQSPSAFRGKETIARE